MIKSSIEKLAPVIGFEIGVSDDVVQSELLNGFCKGLKNSIKDNGNLEQQICFIVDKLDANAENIIIELYEFVKLKQK